MKVALNKEDYAVLAELFFRFRDAKRMLLIDHPTCGCGKSSVGCNTLMRDMMREGLIVEGICEEHWTSAQGSVRWDEMEDASIADSKPEVIDA